MRNPLTQEQINFILDNAKTNSCTSIAKELNISADRVSSVKNRYTYKDLIANYDKKHSSNK